MQDYIDDFLSQDRDINEKGQEFFSSQGRSEFVAKFRQMMMDEGFGKVLPDGSIDPNINDNDLRDLRSCRRLQLIFDTQVEQANSYGQFLEGQDEDILDIWPCWKFVRVRPVMSPRPYHDAALGQIRRKDDLDFWLSLNRDFNVPWGPWGFNSGCGTEDVDRAEAEAAGAIKSSDKVKPIVKDFNDRLQQSVADLGPDVRSWIKRQLGDMVTIHGDKAIYNKPSPPKTPRPDAVPAKGGSYYIGKLYINGYDPSMSKNDFIDRLRASEVLSMGIQRMLESPVSFQRQDPEYYQFIKSQLA
ncbi:MAG: hypothetical protein LUE13_09240 [Akkermansiaceae bacterium]|nr:hypothetical protein [Akkermansiaceae bacterium]